MKNRKVSAVLNAIAMVCWGILLYAGIYERKTVSAILYGICFLCCLISLILNISLIKKEKHHDTENNSTQA